MRKKLKINEINQIHGKDESRSNLQSLEQIWGDTGLNRYNTLDIHEYTERLAEMNKSDLQNHAAKLGLVPVDSRELLVKRLLTEFKKYVSQYEKVRPQEEKSLTQEQKVKKLLSE